MWVGVRLRPINAAEAAAGDRPVWAASGDNTLLYTEVRSLIYELAETAGGAKRKIDKYVWGGVPFTTSSVVSFYASPPFQSLPPFESRYASKVIVVRMFARLEDAAAMPRGRGSFPGPPSVDPQPHTRMPDYVP